MSTTAGNTFTIRPTEPFLDMNRRSFFTAAAGAAAVSVAGLALGAEKSQTKPGSIHPRKRIKLGVCTYSYWHFRDPKVSIETVIEKASQFGVEGVDILHRQMDIPEKEPLTTEHRVYLQKLKRHAFRNGIDLVCLSIHQNFVQRSEEHTSELQSRLHLVCRLLLEKKNR